jgi:hypothetical protein
MRRMSKHWASFHNNKIYEKNEIKFNKRLTLIFLNKHHIARNSVETSVFEFFSSLYHSRRSKKMIVI